MKKFVVSEELLDEVLKHLGDLEEHIHNSSGCLRSIHAYEVSGVMQKLKSSEREIFPKLRTIIWCELKVEEMHVIYKPTSATGSAGYEYRLEEVK